VGFWDWLKPKASAVALSDVVWLTPAAKMRGLRQDVEKAAGDVALVLIATHFPATLKQVERELKDAGTEFLIHSGRLSSAELLQYPSRAKVLLALAETLLPEESPGVVPAAAEAFLILVAERHFLRAHDDHIAAFASGLARSCQLVFHLSLRDPLMRQFAGEWVEGMLVRLGMDESTPIESRMVAVQLF